MWSRVYGVGPRALDMIVSITGMGTRQSAKEAATA
jgi:hypothetical protein